MRKIILIFLMLITLISTKSQEIIKMEYFIDNDPGYGSATNIPVTPGNMVSATFDINLSGLSNGLHMLLVRAKNDMSAWSMVAHHTFLSLDTSESNITQMEYYFDNDPGYGSGMQVPVIQGKNVNKIFNLDVSGLTSGAHMLVIRVKNPPGTWSIASHRLFINLDQSIPDMVEAEYFFDVDPGFGYGTMLPIIPGSNISQTLAIDATGLAVGEHVVFVRIKDSRGAWSLVNYSWFPVPFVKHWTGTESDDWDKDKNWYPRGIPKNSENILVKGNAANMPVIKLQGLSCNAIEFEPGATMTIMSPNTFTVTGN